MSTPNTARGVNEHYAPVELERHVIDAVRAAGLDPDNLAPSDLAPLDQFHTGGAAASRQLAERAGFRAGDRVLDIGGGLGGPARLLASEFGCRVTVLDLTAEFCRVGALLTEGAKLGDAVTFQQGDATAMPFDDASFDGAWTMHSTMNIADKERLYAEVARVLRPGGLFAMYEVVAGPAQPVTYPLPWARDASISFLRSMDETRAVIAAAGLREIAWEDDSAAAVAWFREQAAQRGNARPPLSLSVVLPDIGPALQNMARQVAEDRLRVVRGIFERP